MAKPTVLVLTTTPTKANSKPAVVAPVIILKKNTVIQPLGIKYYKPGNFISTGSIGNSRHAATRV